MFGISTGSDGTVGAAVTVGTTGGFLGAMTISPLVDVTGDLKPDGCVKSTHNETIKSVTI